MSSIHDTLGKISYNMLPEWERQLWAGQRDMIPEYCFFPDTHLSVQLEPDKEKTLRKYCVMSNGKPVPHGPCDDDYRSCVFSNYHSRKTRNFVIGYYLKKMVNLLKKRNFEEAAKFGGVFAHYLQDSSCPGHVINNLLVNRLFPPENGKYWHYHRIIDSWPCKEEEIIVRPVLMGTSIEEAVFHICAEQDRVISSALSLLCPLITSIRKNDRKNSDLICRKLNSAAVRFGSSGWHTAFCIAFGKFLRSEKKLLEKVILSNNIPINEVGDEYSREKLIRHGIDFYETKYEEADPSRSRLSSDPYPFEPVPDCAFDGHGRTIPLALNIHGKNKLTRKTFKNGIAAGTYSILTFEVPGRIFREFRVLCGIHPITNTDEKAGFAVFCEQSLQKAFIGGRISKNDPPVEFTIPLRTDCKTISLIVSGGTPGIHAVWANPLLIKR